MMPKGENGGEPSPPRSPSPLGPSRERGRSKQRDVRPSVCTRGERRTAPTSASSSALGRGPGMGRTAGLWVIFPEGWIPLPSQGQALPSAGMTGRGGGGLLGCGVWVFILFCLLGFGSAMEGPGLSFRGRGASLVQPRVPVSHGRQARGSRQRASLPPVFQFGSTHSEGWGTRFLAAVAGFMGISEGNDGGEVSKGHKARGFSAGLPSEERAA